MKVPTYHKDLIRELKDPKFALEYLNECLEGGDEGTFLLALRHVAEAQGGFARLAWKAKLSREHLFRMLSKKGNPRLVSLKNLAEALGWRLAIVEKHQSPLRQAA
jgi:probable addiction module antidote protein